MSPPGAPETSPAAPALPVADPPAVAPVGVAPPEAARLPVAAPALLAQLALVTCAALYFVSVVRFGWVSDDGFITARSIHNLLGGHGLVANVGYRVQSFTSPLWMLLCLPLQALSGSPYSGLALAGLLCSAAFVAVIARGFRDRPWAGAAVLAVATASSSFLTYSTSGLENPLAHTLVALFCLERLRHGPGPTRATFLLGGLLFLTRNDYALLVAPSLLWAVRLAPRPSLRPALFLLVPVGVWLLVSTFYYGFPFANTAYAKLNTAIPVWARLQQGITYAVDATFRDPALPVFTAAGMVVAWRAARSRQIVGLLLGGVLAYLAYILWIGGDFMGGRFFTVGLCAAVVIAVHECEGALAPALPAAAVLALLLGLANFTDRRVDRGTECVVPTTGIVDERACYVEHTGLAMNIRTQKWRTHGYLDHFRKAVESAQNDVVVYDLIGLPAFALNRPIHVVERYALSEPLLARIRYRAGESWRPGHYFRDVPEGYLETLRTGVNTIKDPCLHQLWDRLEVVIHGPLFSLRRFGTMAALNFGRGTCPAPKRE